MAKDGYRFWNIGWYDFKNILFYQTNVLLENKLGRVQYLSLWMDFLQTLITNLIYKNIFEYFGFEGSTLIGNDRFIYEQVFTKILLGLKFCKEQDKDVLEFICDLFKSNNNMISYSLVKKKISSNLKNFFDGIDNNDNTSHTNNAYEEQFNEVNGQA